MVAAILVIGRFAERWVVGLGQVCGLAATASNLALARYSEDEADESVVADIGIERPERLAEIAARLQQDEVNRAEPIAAGSR